MTTTTAATTALARRALRSLLFWATGFLGFPELLGVLRHLVLPPTDHLTGDPS